MTRMPYIEDVDGNAILVDGALIVGCGTRSWRKMRGTNNRNKNGPMKGIEVSFR